MQVVLDTDILSAIMRRDTRVIPAAQQYLKQYGKFTFSIITRYEILRGLKAKDADQKVAKFNLLSKRSIVLPITDKVIVRAAGIYADLRKHGEIIGDADILIAATALVNGLKVATNNTKHFDRISDLTIENWLQPTVVEQLQTVPTDVKPQKTETWVE